MMFFNHLMPGKSYSQTWPWYAPTAAPNSAGQAIPQNPYPGIGSSMISPPMRGGIPNRLWDYGGPMSGYQAKGMAVRQKY